MPNTNLSTSGHPKRERATGPGRRVTNSAPEQGARCFCGRMHKPYDCIAPYDPNHPDFRSDIWEQAVLNMDVEHGYTIEFAPSAEGHEYDYQVEYERLLTESCANCGVLRSNCKPGGRWYDTCPLAGNDKHDFRESR
jgi:hypothetical protein